jgi:hypothetical protein
MGWRVAAIRPWWKRGLPRLAARGVASHPCKERKGPGGWRKLSALNFPPRCSIPTSLRAGSCPSAFFAGTGRGRLLRIHRAKTKDQWVAGYRVVRQLHNIKIPTLSQRTRQGWGYHGFRTHSHHMNPLTFPLCRPNIKNQHRLHGSDANLALPGSWPLGWRRHGSGL